MDDATAFSEIRSAHFYDLTKEIPAGVGKYTQKEVSGARDLAINEVGPSVVRDEKPEIMLYDDENEQKLMVIYIIFDQNTPKKSNIYANRRIWIHNHEIIQIRYD